MEILETDYIIGLWYVHGWMGKQEVDIQFSVKRSTPDAKWHGEGRIRYYMDNLIDYRETKDKKSFYKINFGTDDYATEETIINKFDKMVVATANDLTGTKKAWSDRILIQDMGSKFLEICESANKPWMNITRVPIEEAKKYMNISDKNS